MSRYPDLCDKAQPVPPQTAFLFSMFTVILNGA
jgi:hypothetical protein